MDLEIVKLSPDRLEGYLNFFDTVAFADHHEWSGCYCVEPHLGFQAAGELEKGTASKCREHAIDFITTGKLRGYLAYRDGEVVGWCNVNDKANYEKIAMIKELQTEEDHRLRIKSVMCFVIAPASRGQGVATAILRQVIADARAEGYDAVEAYPAAGADNAYDAYGGPAAMYEKQGFESLRGFDVGFMSGSIVRKYLK